MTIIERFDRWASTLTADDFEDVRDLTAITNAADAEKKANAELVAAVAHARDKGRSWNRIGRALGVSRQAARQRFTGAN